MKLGVDLAQRFMKSVRSRTNGMQRGFLMPALRPFGPLSPEGELPAPWLLRLIVQSFLESSKRARASIIFRRLRRSRITLAEGPLV